MNLYHSVIGICWLAFFAAWGILAMVFGGGSRRSYTPRAIGARIMIVFAIIFGFRFGGRLAIHPAEFFSTEAAAAGCVLCIAGLVFATWARVVLGSNWGMPMTLHEDPELVTSGPYRYVRHPIYTGLTAMWLGTLLVYPVTALPGIVIIAHSIYSAVCEERDMEQRFPEAYPEYKKRSKMLLPFLI